MRHIRTILALILSTRLVCRAISATAALAMVIVFAVIAALTQSAQAQTYTVLHNFADGQDGASPYAGLTKDTAGNLYGTAESGGGPGARGVVFKLAHKGSGWVLTTLYAFRGGSDGAAPYARVVFGPDGSLYGTTNSGGSGCNGEGCGTVFNLKASPLACKAALCPWIEKVLYRFSGGSDGANPGLGDLIFDQAGNLYGTTLYGGSNGAGTVYELTPSGSGWTERVLYSFSGGNDGSQPWAGLIFDQAGNLYGTTYGGGTYDAGTVFQLTPSGSGWTEHVLYSFQLGNDGGYPFSGLIFDAAGNLYGASSLGGSCCGGAAFELTPSDGTWTFTLGYDFNGTGGPLGTLVMDGGNFYGTTFLDGAYQQGAVFELTPSAGSWTYTDLHDFTGGGDGSSPIGNVIFDAHGNLYGTASTGGASGHGVVWEINTTPPPATCASDGLYSDGALPDGAPNGTIGAYDIDFGFVTSDTFTISSGGASITGICFYAWVVPDDIPTSVEGSITSGENGGTSYFDQTLNLTCSVYCTAGQSINGGICGQGVFNVYACTTQFPGPTMQSGGYWLNLQNASTPGGDAVSWDQNNGPSMASQTGTGLIKAESFVIYGGQMK